MTIKMKLLGSNSWVLQIDIENFFFKIGYHLGEKLDSIITRKRNLCRIVSPPQQHMRW